MTSTDFTCALCHQTFTKAASDEEALAECDNLFGIYPVEELELVCDDCFKMMDSMSPIAEFPRRVEDQ